VTSPSRLLRTVSTDFLALRLFCFNIRQHGRQILYFTLHVDGGRPQTSLSKAAAWGCPPSLWPNQNTTTILRIASTQRQCKVYKQPTDQHHRIRNRGLVIYPRGTPVWLTWCWTGWQEARHCAEQGRGPNTFADTRSRSCCYRWRARTNRPGCTAPRGGRYPAGQNITVHSHKEVLRQWQVTGLHRFGSAFFIRCIDPIFFWKDRKKLSQFGQNVRKGRLVNTVSANFNTIIRQVAEMSQRKEKRFESINNFLKIGNRLHVTLRILNPKILFKYISIFLVDSNLNIEKCKFESSQNDESRAQSTDSSKAMFLNPKSPDSFESAEGSGWVRKH